MPHDPPSPPTAPTAPIAVVGLACRLPGAGGPDALWNLLATGTDAVGAPPPGREARGPGGFVDGVGDFDAAFFGISPREAAAMDPQQRLALELAWEALEGAGLVPASLAGTRAAVVVGAIADDYAALAHRLGPGAVTAHSATGTARSMIANRLSYTLGLRGPSLVVDSGQSSSLVAVHLACERLRAGDAHLALAGGVSLALAAEADAELAGFGALSPTGRCRTFDTAADGYVRGEGGALVVLAPLEAALAAAYPVLAVIAGSAVNNDGGGAGLTVPDQAGQEDVVRTAWAASGLPVTAAQYVELHGTGTRVGDPVEAAALGAVFGPAGAATAHGTAAAERAPLLVGSVKTNIGHLEGAAGIAGLAKAVLALRHRRLPPTLHHTGPPPGIDLGALGLRVVTEATDWPGPAERLAAGVSSFGMGGTNCHVVLVDAPAPPHLPGAPGARRPSVPEPAGVPGPAPADGAPPAVPWVVSGRTSAALRDQAARLAEALAPSHRLAVAGHGPAGGEPDASAVDVGWTLATARTHFAHRAALVGRHRDELVAGLRALAAGEPGRDSVTGVAAEGGTAVLFAGQGAQRAGAGRALYAAHPVFADAFEAACAALDPHLDRPLRPLAFAEPGSADAALLDRTEYTQPALLALEVAQYRLVEHWGVLPDAVAGHSVGELAAAHVAGVLSLEDAATLVAARGRLMQELPPGGAMVAVAAPEDEVAEFLVGRDHEVALAAVNGPEACVVAGDEAAVLDVAARLAGRGRKTTRLRVSHAFHSPRMAPMLDAFRHVAAGVELRPAAIPVVSNVTGELADPASFTAPGYWVDHVCRPVRFLDGLRSLDAAGVTRYLELGPDGPLSAAVREATPGATGRVAVPLLRRDRDEGLSAVAAVAALHTAGVPVDWPAVLAGTGARRVGLPTYAWQRRRYWLPQAPPAGAAGDAPGGEAGPPAAPAPAADLLEAPGPVGAAGEEAPAPPEGTPADERSPKAGAGPLGAALAGAPAGPARARAALDAVRRHAAVVLGYEAPDEVAPDATFRDLGLHSLTAVELRDRLAAALGAALPASLVFDHPTPADLADHVAALVGTGEGATTAAAPPRRSPSAAPATARPADDPVAIVAMACRLPGADSPERLWELLDRGGDAVGPVPADRGWGLDALYDPDADRPGHSYVRHGGFLAGADGFDAGLFGISHREALAMEPQQRVLLEVAWEAIERAGLTPAALRGSPTGVYVGAMPQAYGPGMAEAPGNVEGYLLTGTTTSVASGRVAYALGLEGPAVTVDTACSSSLVALHLAARALRGGECTLALAGGVTVFPGPGIFVELSRQRALSPSGRSRAFSADADGTGWAEGAGVVVLERLSDARRHGHPVLALIRGSAVNQDGASNGLTAPSGLAQQRVIRAALADAGVGPGDVDLIEAHGTGTRLGDPIEAEALAATYGRAHGPDRPAWLGSLKSNVGHTQAAAGVAGVVKAVLALRHGVAPRTLHAAVPTPHVDWATSGLRVLTEPAAWSPADRPRRAAVSSFGISGTNAHLVVEEAPSAAVPAGQAAVEAPDAAGDDGRVRPFLVSARTGTALAAQAGRLRDVVGRQPEPALDGLARALATGRGRFERRAVVLAAGRDELVAGLDALATGAAAAAVPLVQGTAAPRRVAFVFPGQGSQWPGMAAGLLAEPAFARRASECDEALRAYVDWSVIDVIAGRDGAPPLDRVDVVQPALFTMMTALAELWRAHGVEPAAVVGHSQGEVAAACVAGALSTLDAARVVALRSQAWAELPPGHGTMASILLPVTEVEPRLGRWGGRVVIAAHNSPGACAVAGDAGPIDELVAELVAEGARARRIPGVLNAGHSPHVDPLRERLLAELAPVAPRPSAVPFYSTVTGGLHDGGELGNEYWYRNMREPVRFADAVRALLADGHDAFVEPSPHPMLAMPVAELADEMGGEAVTVVSLRRGEGGRTRALAALAEAHTAGVDVDWSPVVGSGPSPVGDLPTYPFERRTYWLPPAGAARLRPDDMLHRVAWQPRPAVPPAAVGPGGWCVLGEGPEARALAAGLAVAGVRVTAQPHVAALAGAVAAGAQPPAVAAAVLPPTGGGAGVGADAGVGAGPGDPAPDREDAAGSAAVAAAVRDASHRVLALVQEWAAAPALDEVTLAVATRGGVAARDGEPVRDLGHAAAWGLVRSAQSESPGRFVLADADPAGGPDPGAAAACADPAGGPDPGGAAADGAGPALVAAIATALAAGEAQVAVRGVDVLVPRLVAAGAVAPPAAPPPALPAGGTVLVTGASGTLGAMVTRHLVARHGVRRLVLASRRGAAAPGAAELVAELAAAGADARVVACDVGDRAAVDALVASVPTEHPLAGVVHAAGILDDGIVASLTPDRLDAVARPKVDAALHLDAATRHLDLPLFALYSSMVATLGHPGQAGYAAANAVLDAVATRRRAAGRPALSLGWGFWAERSAMSAHLTDRDVGRMRSAGVDPLGSGEGLALLDRAWASVAPVLLPIAFAPDVLRARAAAGDLPPLLSALAPGHAGGVPASAPAPAGATSAGDAAAEAPAGPGEGLAARLAALPAGERERALLDLVREHAAAVVGHPDPGSLPAQRALRESGFDSLTAVELRNRLAAAAGLSLPATVVFDHPSPAALAAVLLDRLVGQDAGAGFPPTPSVPASPAAPGGVRPGAPPADDPVAIVASACRLPGGVRSPEDLWDVLVAGRDVVSPFPTDRGWSPDLHDPDPGRPGRSVADHGGFLYDAADFDADFFGISPREALAMDPQQRLLLEVAWEAIERAGIDPATVAGTDGGVFVGSNGQDYTTRLDRVPEDLEGYTLTGTAASVASGRVAYALGLQGPAVTVDTACSSSLVALHLACQALRRGECSLALAGGVTVMSTPRLFVEFSRQRGLAPDGRCKAFSDGADGTSWSEGVGLLVLERLSEARRRGHPVLAVVRGSAVNQDGASNGLAAPNGPSQQRVIRSALADAGVAAADVDVVEAHGTGTTLGDPIEAQALLATYGQGRRPGEPTLLGALKSNIGHTQAAAGVAGVIKLVLALGHRYLPRTLHVARPSGHVDWSSGDVALLQEPMAWPDRGRPARAGISAFGISGTNAHAIIEQAPPEEAPAPGDRPPAEEAPHGEAPPEKAPAGPPLVFLVAGRGADALRAQAARLRIHVEGGDQPLPALARALATTRTAFDRRAAVLAGDRDALVAGLDAVAAGRPAPGVVAGTRREGRTAFLFTGQGAQRPGMGAGLAAAHPVFADAFAEVCAALDRHLDRPLAAVAHAAPGTPDAVLLDRTAYAQPALFAVEVALARLLASWGVVPDVVAGHSIGELAAVHVAGALSLDDAATLVTARGRLMDALPSGGAMVALQTGEARVRSALDGQAGIVAIAAVNGPDATVIAGEEGPTLAVADRLAGEGVRARRLRVSHAFHSPLMDPVLDDLRRVAAGLAWRPPQVPVVSTVTGRPLDAAALADPGYWARHARDGVRFADAVRHLVGDGAVRLAEVGPGGGLAATARDGLAGDRAVAVAIQRRDRPEPEALLLGVAELHAHGAAVDWAAALPATGEPAAHVALPTYAFQRRRFWLDAPAATPGTGPAAAPPDDEFWAAVASGDPAVLAATLGLDGTGTRGAAGPPAGAGHRGDGAGPGAEAARALRSVLPALAGWRRRRVDTARIDGWRYRERWRPIDAGPAAPLPGRWLLAVPEGAGAGTGHGEATNGAGTARRLAAAVRALIAERRGVTVVVEVPAGADRATVAALVAEGLAGGPPPAGVVSLLALDERPLAAHAGVPTGLAGTLALAQALDDMALDARLWVLTAGGVVAGAPGAAPVAPAQAAVWGLGRVLGLERPSRLAALVDLPAGAVDRDLHTLGAVLADPGDEDQVAVRAGGALARRLVPAPAAAASGGWVPRGTVVVTGGTGGLGAHVARWLAGNGAEHVVLASRRGPDAEGAGALAGELRAAGARVTVVACDMADRASVAGLLATAGAGGRLRAVVHAAGVGDMTPLDSVGPDELAAVAGGKVAGASHLDELLGDRELDAFVLFSSVAAVWGSGGQAAYAAANAYLDGLATRRRAAGRAATSVAWGPWADDGMITGEGVAEHLTRRGLVPMAPALAVGAMRSAVAAGEAVVAVADVDWPRFASAYTAARHRPLLDDLPALAAAGPGRAGGDGVGPRGAGAGGPAPVPLAARLATMPAADAGHELLDLVRGHVAGVLGHATAAAVPPERAFRDLGLDSLMAVELRDRLNADTGLDLRAVAIFDNPDPESLAAHIHARLASAPGPEASARAAGNGNGAAPPVDAADLASAEDLFRLIDDELGAP